MYLYLFFIINYFCDAGLAHGLGEEIEMQNDLVENIISKADKADITIQRQNKAIKNLLK